MKQNTNQSRGVARELRRKAEEKLQSMQQSGKTTWTAEEEQKLLHELQVHQIELEMQNEELLRIQDELELSHARYFDLFELAPVGYLFLSKQGLILDANLTAATLLGRSPCALHKNQIAQLIAKEDQDVYYLHHRNLFETEQPQSCELRMLKADVTALWVRLEASAARDMDGTPTCRVTLSDISKRKQLEEAIQTHLSELEIFNKAAVDRELRMIELKKEVNALCRELGKPAAYVVDPDGEL